MEQKIKFNCKDDVIYRPKGESAYIWVYGIFSHYDGNGAYIIGADEVLNLSEYDILPLAGNQHLVGTSDMPEEEVKLEKGEQIICNNDVELLKAGIGFLTTFAYNDIDAFFTGKTRFVNDEFRYVIKFSDFNLNDLEETKKHILYVRNGKIIKYGNKA